MSRIPNAHSSDGRAAVTPRAQRIMKQRGVSAEAVNGSGPAGRIVEADVIGLGSGGKGQVCALTPMRKSIAQITSRSFSSVPHFYLRAEVDATELVNTRKELADGFEREHGVKTTITDFILRAMALSLSENPYANCIWKGDGPVQLGGVDIGLMVSVEEGLIVPVIRNADRLGLAALARERIRLVAAARVGRIPAESLSGGATSLSNLGAGRVDDFGAIIFPPQSSILAVGRAAPRPFVVGNELCVRTTIRLSLSIDHRIMDGVNGGKYLGQIVEFLENPSRIIS